MDENFAYRNRHAIISIMRACRVVDTWTKKGENFDANVDELIRLVDFAFHSYFSRSRIMFPARTCTISWYISAGIMKNANSLILFYYVREFNLLAFKIFNITFNQPSFFQLTRYYSREKKTVQINLYNLYIIGYICNMQFILYVNRFVINYACVYD